MLFLSRFFFRIRISNTNGMDDATGSLAARRCGLSRGKEPGGIAGNPWVVAQSGTLLALRVNAAPASCRASSSLIPSSRLSYRSCTRHFLTRRFPKIGWKYMINREIKIRENCFEETEWKREREREKLARTLLSIQRGNWRRKERSVY